MLKDNRLIGLFWPVLVEQIFATAVTMLGSVLVSGVSQEAMAGTGLVDSFNFLVLTVLTAISTGVTVIVAQWTGKGDMRRASETALQSLVLSTLVSALMAAVLMAYNRRILTFLFSEADPLVIDEASIFLFYSLLSLPVISLITVSSGVMRATGNVKAPMIGAFISTASYVLLALCLVRIFRLGVSGIGISLLVSRLGAAAYQLASLRAHPGRLNFPRFTLRMQWAVLMPVLVIALPAGADQVIFNGSKLIVQRFMSGMGTPAMAANTLAGAMTNLMQLPGRALQVIIVTIVGQLYGAQLYRQAQKQLLAITGLGSAIQLIASLLFIPLMPVLFRLYNPSAEVGVLTEELMRLMLWSTPLFWPAAFVTPCGLRTVDRVTFTMIVSIASMLALRLMMSYVLGVQFGLGVMGIWIAMVLDWVGRAVFFLGRNIVDFRAAKDIPA